MISWPRLGLVAVATVLIQITFFDQTMLLDLARMDLPAFLLVGLANKLEPEEAAISGFGLGLILDLFYTSPFGLFGFIFCLAAWAIAIVLPIVDAADTVTRFAARALQLVSLWFLVWFAGGVFGMGRPPLGLVTISELLLIMGIGGLLSDPDRGLARPVAVT